uniref:COMM domain-containing protein 5 n=1 Tax=Strigamia maritima TaxID=126957 RepID=T1IRI1_STRMM
MDGVTLFGARVPKSALVLHKHLDGLEKQIFRNFVQVIVSSIEGKVIPNNSLTRTSEGSKSKNDFEIIFSGLYLILKAALKLPQSVLKPVILQENLKALRIPNEFAEDLTNVIYGKKRAALDEATLNMRPSLLKLNQLKWRVDVTISTSFLSRVLQPSILIQMALSDGRTITFEVSISKFHLLRYSVANVLKEMEELGKRNIFKLQD